MSARHERDGSRPHRTLERLQRRFAQHAVARQACPLLELEHRDSRRVVRHATDELGREVPELGEQLLRLGNAEGLVDGHRGGTDRPAQIEPREQSERHASFDEHAYAGDARHGGHAAYQLRDTGRRLASERPAAKRPPRSTVTMRRSIATPRSGVARGTALLRPRALRCGRAGEERADGVRDGRCAALDCDEPSVLQEPQPRGAGGVGRPGHRERPCACGRAEREYQPHAPLVRAGRALVLPIRGSRPASAG